MLIGGKYKVESDSLNVTLSKKEIAKKTGFIRWRPIAYFSHLSDALDYLVDLEVKETGLKDLRVIVEKQKELYQLIEGLKHRPETLQLVRR